MKRCSRCKTLKDESEFCKDRSRPNGLNHRCKPCNRTHVQEIAVRQKQQMGKAEYRKLRRKWELPHYYGITAEQYTSLVEQQNNQCAICGKNPETYLAVDHCHRTGKIRGLLCRRCNSAIGLFDENQTTIRNALQYLCSKPQKKQ